MANNTAQGKTLEKKGFKLPISGNALVLLVALVLVTAIFSALNPNISANSFLARSTR